MVVNTQSVQKCKGQTTIMKNNKWLYGIANIEFHSVPFIKTKILVENAECWETTTGTSTNLVDLRSLSECVFLSTSTSSWPEPSFFTLIGSPARPLMTFDVTEGDNWFMGPSGSSDLITRNLGHVDLSTFPATEAGTGSELLYRV